MLKKVAIFSFITLAFSGVMDACTNESGARHALEAEGFTDIEITGYTYGECGKDDDTCTGFHATGPSGQHVSGAVGCGYNIGCSKGCTVRIDH